MKPRLASVPQRNMLAPYLRFGRMAVPFIFEPDYKIEIGKGVKLKDGKDVTPIATGLMTGMALEAAETLKNEGIDARVINIHTIKPIDREIIINAAKGDGCRCHLRGSVDNRRSRRCRLRGSFRNRSDSRYPRRS